MAMLFKGLQTRKELQSIKVKGNILGKKSMRRLGKLVRRLDIRQISLVDICHLDINGVADLVNIITDTDKITKLELQNI